MERDDLSTKVVLCLPGLCYFDDQLDLHLGVPVNPFRQEVIHFCSSQSDCFIFAMTPWLIDCL